MTKTFALLTTDRPLRRSGQHWSPIIVVGLLLPLVPCSVLAADEPTDPRKPPAIETREIPVVPTELFAKLTQFQNVRAAGFRGWSPAGDGILISTRFGNSVQLHRVDAPVGRREQITFFDEPVTGGFLPASVDDAILLSMDTGGNENNQLHLLEPRQYRVKRLTDGKSRNNLQAVAALTVERWWCRAIGAMAATWIFIFPILAWTNRRGCCCRSIARPTASPTGRWMGRP